MPSEVLRVVNRPLAHFKLKRLFSFYYNPLVVPLDEILIQFAVVGGLPAGEVVGNVGLLEQDVAVVLLVV